jgi:hypothetical protein
MFSLLAALVAQLRNAFADRRDLVLENAALRQQLAISRRKGNRLPLTSTDLCSADCLTNTRGGLPDRLLGPHTVLHQAEVLAEEWAA